jgi:hypothetical protein
VPAKYKTSSNTPIAVASASSSSSSSSSSSTSYSSSYSSSVITVTSSAASPSSSSSLSSCISQNGHAGVDTGAFNGRDTKKTQYPSLVPSLHSTSSLPSLLSAAPSPQPQPPLLARGTVLTADYHRGLYRIQFERAELGSGETHH